MGGPSNNVSGNGLGGSFNAGNNNSYGMMSGPGSAGGGGY